MSSLLQNPKFSAETIFCAFLFFDRCRVVTTQVLPFLNHFFLFLFFSRPPPSSRLMSPKYCNSFLPQIPQLYFVIRVLVSLRLVAPHLLVSRATAPPVKVSPLSCSQFTRTRNPLLPTNFKGSLTTLFPPPPCTTFFLSVLI